MIAKDFHENNWYLIRGANNRYGYRGETSRPYPGFLIKKGTGRDQHLFHKPVYTFRENKFPVGPGLWLNINRIQERIEFYIPSNSILKPCDSPYPDDNSDEWIKIQQAFYEIKLDKETEIWYITQMEKLSIALGFIGIESHIVGFNTKQLTIKPVFAPRLLEILQIYMNNPELLQSFTENLGTLKPPPVPYEPIILPK